MSEATTVTLVDFLLARIAEDEAATFDLLPCAPEGWVGHRCLICGTPASYGGTVAAITEIAEEHEESVHRRSRTLRECKAKRRIAEEHPTGDDGYCGGGDYWGTCGCSWLAPCRTLIALAAIYADHPDYRDEWRP